MQTTTYVTRDKLGIYTPGESRPRHALMGADTLLGNDVYNPQGDDLGDIREFMIDMASGQVAYAVLSFGGLLGMGDKLFAVPWSALTLDRQNQRFTLDVAKERLRDAPGFDKKHWPAMADPAWARSLHAFYGTTNRAS
jgi:sporulation protein YlmC with PRC-barrel domain